MPRLKPERLPIPKHMHRPCTPAPLGFSKKQAWRLCHRFITDPECSPVHRDEVSRLQVEKSLEGGGGMEMEVLEPSFRFVGSDRQQRNVDRETRADFREEIIICRIAGKINGVRTGLNNVSNTRSGGWISRPPLAQMLCRFSLCSL